MIGLDTNILLRLWLNDDPAQNKRIDKLLAEHGGTPGALLVSDVVLAEAVWTLRSAYRQNKAAQSLAVRSLLDETLVVLISEHGRTPKVNNAAGGGRDHWSRAYSVLFTGGGVPRGQVIGATDAVAGDVVERPISPKSLLATMYHLLGISPHQELVDAAGRPTPLLPHEAEVIPELLG